MLDELKKSLPKTDSFFHLLYKMDVVRVKINKDFCFPLPSPYKGGVKQRSALKPVGLVFVCILGVC